MSDYLITGGAGFIGSNFVEMLLAKGGEEVNSVTILDKLTYSGLEDNISRFREDTRFNFVHGDIQDSDLVLGLMSSVDFIVNFAAESHVDRSIRNPITFVDSNIRGLAVLLDTYLKVKGKRFVQVSTDEVYGSLSDGSAVEDYPLLPNSPYAASKAAGDLLIRAYTQTFGCDVRITRCGNNFGPYQHPEKLIPRLITRALKGKALPIYGNGINVREWVTVQDHCIGIYSALHSEIQGGVFNLGSKNSYSNNFIAETILSLVGNTKSEIQYVQDRPGHDFRYSLDYQKASKVLNYKPSNDFSKDLNETVNWYKNHEEWWGPLVRNSDKDE
jgi:dTDP-glucose 4,6-dehydratase